MTNETLEITVRALYEGVQDTLQPTPEEEEHNLAVRDILQQLLDRAPGEDKELLYSLEEEFTSRQAAAEKDYFQQGFQAGISLILQSRL